MKGSNGVRFTVAVIVGIVTIFGGLSVFTLSLCSGLYAQTQKAWDDYGKSRNVSHEEYVRGTYIPASDALGAVWKAKRQQFWSYCPAEIRRAYDEESFGKVALNYFFVVMIIDGVVLGAYQFFGKSKEKRESVEKVRDEKES